MGLTLSLYDSKTFHIVSREHSETGRFLVGTKRMSLGGRGGRHLMKYLTTTLQICEGHGRQEGTKKLS